MDRSNYINAKLYDTAECMTYDTDLVIFKRFNRLNYYNLLKLQYKLGQLDTQITNSVIVGTADVSDELTEDLRGTLKEYNEALLAQSRLGTAQSPPQRAVKTMKDFLEQMRNEVALRELSLDGDVLENSVFVALAQIDKSWIHQMIDKYQWMRKMFEKPSPNSNLMIYSEDGVRQSVRFFVPLAFSIVLVAPIVVMSLCKDNNTKLGVLIGFVFSTSAVVCWLTKAKDWEVLTVTAGYCAILVVFIGQTQMM